MWSGHLRASTPLNDLHQTLSLYLCSLKVQKCVFRIGGCLLGLHHQVQLIRLQWSFTFTFTSALLHPAVLAVVAVGRGKQMEGTLNGWSATLESSSREQSTVPRDRRMEYHSQRVSAAQSVDSSEQRRNEPSTIPSAGLSRVSSGGPRRRSYATRHMTEKVLDDEGHPFEGHGSFVFSDGKYDGYFKSGQRSGVGTLSYTSGARYAGQWRKGYRHGKGVFKYARTHALETKMHIIDVAQVDDLSEGQSIFINGNGSSCRRRSYKTGQLNEGLKLRPTLAASVVVASVPEVYRPFVTSFCDRYDQARSKIAMQIPESGTEPQTSQASWIHRVEQQLHQKLSVANGVVYVVCIKDFEDKKCIQERTCLLSRIQQLGFEAKATFRELTLEDFFAMNFEN